MVLEISIGIFFLFSATFLLWNAREGRKARRHAARISGASSKLSVTLIIPIKGADAFTEECFRSWLNQNYSNDFQIIFSLQDPADPALNILENLRGVRDFEVIVNPIRPGFSGKMSNFFYGLAQARNECIISSDADIVASADTVGKLTSLLESQFDLVSCLVQHERGQNAWARIYAATWNVGLFYLWAPFLLKGKSAGIAGGTFAIRRKTLDALGPLDQFRSYIAEDLALGYEAERQGLRIGLGPLVKSPVGKTRFKTLCERLRRASLCQIHMNPWGPLAGLLLNLMLNGYFLVLLLAVVTHSPALLGIALLAALLRPLLVGQVFSVSGEGFRFAYETWPGDLLSLVIFISACISKSVVWRGVRYRVGRGGRMVAIP